MILNNFWKWLSAVTSYNLRGTGSGTLVTNCGFVNISGENVTTLIGYGGTSGTQLTGVATTRDLTNIDLIYGGGTNTYTADSYALVSPLNNDLGNLTVSYTSSGTNGWFETITGSGINTTNADLTITEVAIRKPFAKDYDSSTVSDNMLIAIVPLQSAIVVPPNGSFTVTIAVNML